MAKVDSVDFLNKLGKAKETVSTTSNNPLAQILIDFAKENVEIMKANTPKASGALSASIGFKFGNDGGVLVIDFLADDYWDYINSGVDGVRSSAGAITNKFGQSYSFKTEAPSRSMVDSFMGQNKQNWLASKGITSLTYGGETYQLTTDEDYRAAAFVFARAVKRKGIQPSNFVGKAINEQTIKQLEQLLIEAMINLL